MQLRGFFPNLLRVFRQLFLFPIKSHRFQKRNEGDGRSDKNLVLHRFFLQIRLDSKSSSRHRFDRNEHHREIDLATYHSRVITFGEIQHCRTHHFSMSLELCIAFCRIGRFHRPIVSRKRHLGIDGNLALPGHVDHQVRALASTLLILKSEITVLGHAGELTNVFKRNFTPATTGLP